MEKKELINEVSAKTGLSKSEAASALDAVCSTIAMAVITDNKKVAIRGFGSFRLRESRARTGRNPRTGESVAIAASKTVAFKPSGSLKVAL